MQIVGNDYPVEYNYIRLISLFRILHYPVTNLSQRCQKILWCSKLQTDQKFISLSHQSLTLSSEYTMWGTLSPRCCSNCAANAHSVHAAAYCGSVRCCLTLYGAAACCGRAPRRLRRRRVPTPAAPAAAPAPLRHVARAALRCLTAPHGACGAIRCGPSRPRGGLPQAYLLVPASPLLLSGPLLLHSATACCAPNQGEWSSGGHAGCCL